MTERDIQNAETTRELFRRAFLDKDQPQVLALILARLGYFADRPEAVKPELIAFGNWILAECGILHTVNPSYFSAQIHDIAQALAATANTADLDALRQTANAPRDEP